MPNLIHPGNIDVVYASGLEILLLHRAFRFDRTNNTEAGLSSDDITFSGVLSARRNVGAGYLPAHQPDRARRPIKAACQ